MLRIAAVAGVSVLLACLGACSGTAPDDGCGVGASELAALSPVTGRAAWVAHLTQASDAPVRVSDGTAVVSGLCGTAVVSLADGRVRYDDRTPGPAVGVAGRQLFVLDSQDQGTVVTGLPLDGSRGGSSFASNTLFGAAVTVGGRLLTLYGGTLEAADAGRLSRAWSTQLPAADHPVLVPAGREVLVTSTDGSTSAVDAATGRLEWRSVPPVAGPSYALRVGVVGATVLTTADTGTGRPFVYATDLATGSLRWTRRGATVLGEDPRLTVLRTGAGLLGVGTRTGAVRWERRPVLVADDTAVALTSTTVVVPGTAAGTLGLDPRTGRTRWRAQAAFSAVASGDVVVTTGSAGVSGLDGRTGAVRWRRAARRGVVAVAVAPGGRVLMLDSDPVPRMGA